MCLQEPLVDVAQAIHADNHQHAVEVPAQALDIAEEVALGGGRRLAAVTAVGGLSTRDGRCGLGTRGSVQCVRVCGAHVGGDGHDERDGAEEGEACTGVPGVSGAHVKPSKRHYE